MSSPEKEKVLDIETTNNEKASSGSGLSKLISNVKRTPSLSDRRQAAAANKEEAKLLSGEKPTTTPRKPPARPERQSLRNLEISGPVLQTSVDHARLHLVPVACQSPELKESHQNKEAAREEEEKPSSKQGSPSLKRPAPQPPAVTAAAAVPPPSAATVKERKGSAPNDDLAVKPSSSSKYSLPWRSVKPNRAAALESKSSDSTAAALPVPKSSSDDVLEQKKQQQAASLQPSNSMRGSRRPASIATSKPVRPNAPPPKPPPTRAGSHETSPEDIYIYDDASAIVNRGGGGGRRQLTTAAPLAHIDESISPLPSADNEPIYDTIGERSSAVSGDDEFLTPPGSPTLTKKSPDTLSTGSSGAEDDGLMREILREVTTARRPDGEESIYSSLMRKKDRNKHKRNKPKSPEA